MSKIKNTDFANHLKGFTYKGNSFSRDYGSHSIYDRGQDELLIAYDKDFDEVYVRFWRTGDLPKSFSIQNASKNMEEIKEKINQLIQI